MSCPYVTPVSLTDMLLSESLMKKDAAVKCLEKLTKDTPEHWSYIVDSGEHAVSLRDHI